MRSPSGMTRSHSGITKTLVRNVAGANANDWDRLPEEAGAVQEGIATAFEYGAGVRE